MPEEGEKYQPGHWRQEELDAWLKGPAGSGIYQGKPEVNNGKVRLINDIDTFKKIAGLSGDKLCPSGKWVDINDLVNATLVKKKFFRGASQNPLKDVAQITKI